jgi:hypothetical protein
MRKSNDVPVVVNHHDVNKKNIEVRMKNDKQKKE